MSLVKEVSYHDVLKVDNRVIKYGGKVTLMLDWNDSRFNNLTALMVDGDDNFRDSCGVKFVYDVENCRHHRLGRGVIYINVNGDEIKIGELSESEQVDLEYWLLHYALDDIESSSLLNELSEEEFNEEYLKDTFEF